MGERVHHPEELQISLLRDDMSAGVQPDSDPMVLESGLHSKALLTTLHNDTRSKEAEDLAAVRAVETSSPAPASGNDIGDLTAAVQLDSGIHNKALHRSKEAEDMAAVRAVETSSLASTSGNGIRNADAEVDPEILSGDGLEALPSSHLTNLSTSHTRPWTRWLLLVRPWPRRLLHRQLFLP
jgi:hypothetical protein